MERTPSTFKVFAIFLIFYLFVVYYFIMATAGPESMNLILPSLEQKFGWNPSDVVAKVSIVKLLAVISGVVLSTLMVKKGIRNVTAPSITLVGLAIAGMGMSQTMGQFVAANIIIGIFTPAIFISQGALISNWFVRNRGKAFGIVTIAAPFSTATFTPIGYHLIEHFSFTALYTSVGAIFTAMGLIGFFVIKDAPEQVGLDPDGIPFTEAELKQIKAMREFKSKWSLVKVLKTKEIWFYCFGWGFVTIVNLGLVVQIVPVLTSGGIEVNKALLMMTVASLMGIPLTYFWGWFSDKVGTTKACVVFAVITIFGPIGFAFGSAESIGYYYLSILCIAIGTGGTPNLMPSHLAYLVGRREFLNVNRYWIIFQSLAISFAFAYVPIMFGILGSYETVFLLLAPFSILAAVLFAFTGKTHDAENMEVDKERERNNAKLKAGQAIIE
ncbi:MFS transporter [Vibrio sp. RC27]